MVEPSATPPSTSVAALCKPSTWAVTSVGTAGTGATDRPISSNTIDSSRKPRPPPPCSSGTAMPVMPAAASFCHSGRSNTEQLSFSSCWRCSCVAPSARISRARARNDFWSSVSEKSTTTPPPHVECDVRRPSGPRNGRLSSHSTSLDRGSSEAPGHLEAEDGDEIALDLVGAAAEGEDQRAAVGPLDPAGEHRPRRRPLQDSRRAEDLEKQPVALAVARGAVDLHAGGVGDVDLADAVLPDVLPVEQPQRFQSRVHLRQMGLHPLLVDDPAAVRQLGLLRPTAGLEVVALQDRRRRERDPFVVELRRDDGPAAVDL